MRYTQFLEIKAKELIQKEKHILMQNGIIKENKERKEENMDNLRTIAKNLVDNFYKYEEIISNLRDIGVKDERIYNIFYEILKNISE